MDQSKHKALTTLKAVVSFQILIGVKRQKPDSNLLKEGLLKKYI